MSLRLVRITALKYNREQWLMMKLIKALIILHTGRCFKQPVKIVCLVTLIFRRHTALDLARFLSGA